MSNIHNALVEMKEVEMVVVRTVEMVVARTVETVVMVKLKRLRR